ncbi:MAG: dihydroxy-acid dehydratase [Marmoricola sp.]
MRLRSNEWFDGDDEVAVLHRVALRNSGIENHDPARPVIGVLDCGSELNPCNLPLESLALHVRAGIEAAGGIAVRLPVMSLGEDLMKPTAMLYRNLLAIEVEEYLRTYPVDGVVLMGNCDKSVPGALMGAASADLPAIMVTGGARPVARFQGKQVGTGTDLWRAWEDHRVGRLSDEQWREFERCLACGLGACNTMGTASTMAILTEALGMALPGTAVIPTGDPARDEAAYLTGTRIVEMVAEDQRPSHILSDSALRNAVKVLHAVGGSSNAVLHVLAIAGRVASSLHLDDIDQLGRDIPVLADVEPSGAGLIQDFHQAGGVPTIMRLLVEHFETDALTVTGRSWAEELPTEVAASGVLRDPSDPLHEGGAFVVVHGDLAPDGAVLKASAASPELFEHTGPAVVFSSYDDMRARIDDPELDVSPESVLVLLGAGPVAVPGMPEWGMIPIPAKLAKSGVSDMVRVTDARMSGTSFGTCFLHVAPEAAVGGPLGLVCDGDLIQVSVANRRIDLLVEPSVLDARRAAWTPPISEHLRGWPALYQAHVTQADTGCDLDFLRAPTQGHRRVISPIVGRS